MGFIFKNEEEFKKNVKELKNKDILPKNISDYEHESLMFDKKVEKMLDELISECFDNMSDLTKMNTYINNGKNIIILKAFLVGNPVKERNVSIKNLLMTSTQLVKNNKKLILDKTLNVVSKKVDKDKKSLVNSIKIHIKNDKDINLFFKLSVLESIIFDQKKSIIFHVFLDKLLIAIGYKKVENLIELTSGYTLCEYKGKLVLEKDKKIVEFDNFVCYNDDKYLESKISENEFITLSIDEKDLVLFSIEKKDNSTNSFNDDTSIKLKGNEMISDLYKKTCKELK